MMNWMIWEACPEMPVNELEGTTQSRNTDSLLRPWCNEGEATMPGQSNSYNLTPVW